MSSAMESELAQISSLADLLDQLPKPLGKNYSALEKSAALTCNVPFSYIYLTNDKQQPLQPSPHSSTNFPCATKALHNIVLHTITTQTTSIFEIEDTHQDPLFNDNPLVKKGNLIRYFASILLQTNDGHTIGLLCLIDNTKRQLTDAQRETLHQLAIAASNVYEESQQHNHATNNIIKTPNSTIQQNNLDHENVELLNIIRSHCIMSITDADGKIIEANDAFCDISQYSRQELVGKKHSITNSGAHPISFFSDLWKSISNGKSWRGEICNRAKDGSLYWISSIITPFVKINGNIDSFISISTDITGRKKQEQELRKSQSLLDRTGKIAGVGGWELDLITEQLYWSEETRRIHGVSSDYEPDLQEAINFYAPSVRPIIQHAVEHAIETGECWDLELPFVQANGNKIWVRAVGSVEFLNDKPVRLIGAFQDISERVHQRSEIDEAHNRISLATDSGKIGIWEYDIIHSVLTWDNWMYRLYGLSPTDKTGTYELWAKHLHPEDRERTEKAVDDAIADIATFDTEFRIIWIDGSIKHIRGAARIIRDEQGNALKMIGANWDVSKLRNLTEQLSEQHELLRVTLDSIGDAVITSDAQGNMQWLNPVAERMTCWTTDKAKGRSPGQVFHLIDEETRQPIENPITTCIAQRSIVELDTHAPVLVSRSGEEYGIECTSAPMLNKEGELLGAVLVFHDVTEQRRLSHEISYQATHDALTGLVNRADFESKLRHLLKQAHENECKHALMYIDLDQFKIVNDTCGHSIGDEVLQQISRLLEKTVRSHDILARLGGDEFGVILEHCTIDQAQIVAEKICHKMDIFRFVHGTHRFRIGTSIGLVPIDNRWATIAEPMQAADTSCYAAKDAGRNRVHTWFNTDIAMHTRHGEMKFTTRIEQALDENRFALYAQRIESLKHQNQGYHAEVLVRMLDTDHSIILPAAFFPAAERFNLATRIDRWVLRNTIDWLSMRSKDEAKINTLCINLSGQSVGDRAFHQYAIDILQKAGQHTCSQICFEITETAAITNITDASLFIDQVRHLHIRVALDDFGAGASSFGYLKNLTVDYLKIDGSFIKNVINDPLDDAAVRCFVDVAKIINLKTVAEFVSDDAILTRVKELGVDYAQGFLLHKPEPISSALNTLPVQYQQ